MLVFIFFFDCLSINQIKFLEFKSKGQFSSNLLIVTRDQWIKPHFNIEEFEEKTNLPKVGTSKKKREFRKEVISDIL